MKTTRRSSSKATVSTSPPKKIVSKSEELDELPVQGSAKESDISRGGVATPFPWKLHEMLEDSHMEGNEWIVSWQPHGRCFIVHKPKVFVEKIMPTYFNQSKYASFQRQLNLYGFSRIQSGKDKGAYYHALFVRHEPDLCRGMIRQKIKGTKVRRTLAPEEEPDFYSMTKTATPAMETVRRVLAQTEEICGEDFFEDTCGPWVSPAESEESDSEDSHDSTPPLPPLKPTITSLPFLEDVGDFYKPEQPLAIDTEEVTTTRPPLRLSSGDLLFFEGKPFHYLEHLDTLPPPSVPKQTDDKNTSYAFPRDSLQSLMRADPQALMGAALNICQVP